MIFRFMYPEICIILIAIPVFIGVWVFLPPPVARIRYSQINIFKNISKSSTLRSIWIPRVLRLIAVSLIILAAARPQKGNHEEIIKSNGIDIILALDISGSMRALDFQPANRLEVAKDVMRKFIEKREHDRIGLVLFGSQSFTLCPLTLDHDLLLEFLDQAQIGMVEEQTAIGKAVANAVNRLRVSGETGTQDDSSQSQGQIVILCTDGVNNVNSQMDPITAAKAAASLGIKIYTIGVGTNGFVDFPDQRFRNRTVKMQVELDEDTLKEIAKTTHGQYFHARNTSALVRIFDAINKLEKVEIDSLKYTRYTEIYQYPLTAGFLLLILELILSQTIYRRFP